MRDAIEACAREWIIHVAGRPLRLAPLSLGEWIELERMARAARPSLIDEVFLKLREQPPELQQQMLEAAYDALLRHWQVTVDELWRWLNTASGRASLFWLAARRHEPELSLPQAAALAARVGAEDWRRLDDQARAHLEQALGN